MNHPKLIVTALLASGLLTLATSVLAGEEDKSEEADVPQFESLDANVDGVITLDEAENSWLASSFSDVDTNHDGLITRTEYEAAIS